MKKTPKEAYAKEIKHKMHSISNMFLTKQEVSKQDAMKRSLSIPMRHSDIDVQYVSAGLKKINQNVKVITSFRKMHPDDTNVLEPNNIDKCENRTDNLHPMCSADFASSYVSKKADDVLIEPD